MFVNTKHRYTRHNFVSQICQSIETTLLFHEYSKIAQEMKYSN